MNTIKATWKNGQIVPDEPVDWPEGCKLTVEPECLSDIGMTEDEQGDDPESIARWLAEFDAIPPLQMKPEEEAAWQAARKAQKEYEKSIFFEHAEKLRRMWE